MLGDTLLALCQSANNEALLVAPFIKVKVLEKLLASIRDSVFVHCVTRWHPHEIASGVNDLEVWPLLSRRPNSTLWLRPDLHAKYYRADNQCLVGSANLTLTALGWKTFANLELLLPYQAQSTELQDFEKELFANAVQVNEGIYAQVLAAVQCMPIPTKTSPSPIMAEEPEEDTSGKTRPKLHASKAWFPTLRYPEDLYKAYLGEWDRLSKGTQIAAMADLQGLMIPFGLDEATFQAYVGAMVLQESIVQKIDLFVVAPQRFGAVKSLLASSYKDIPGFDAGHAWQTLMRWLLYFLPERYSVSTPHHSEIFKRI